MPVRITPLDIRSHVFSRRLQGYDRDEVDAYLRSVAEDYETALRESDRLRERVGALETRVQELMAEEKLLQDTLVSAQKLSEDLKRTAMKEAEILVSEAEIRGEKVLDAAHRRAARLAEEIREMKLLRGRLAAAVRATIEAHLGLLESLAEDPAEEDPLLEGKLASLARDGAGPGPQG